MNKIIEEIGGSAIDSAKIYINKCVNSCAATAGGATGAGPTEECTTPPAYAPTGSASPTVFRRSTPSAATSAPATGGEATAAVGGISAVPPTRSSSGARCSAQEEMPWLSIIISIERDPHCIFTYQQVSPSGSVQFDDVHGPPAPVHSHPIRPFLLQ